MKNAETFYFRLGELNFHDLTSVLLQQYSTVQYGTVHAVLGMTGSIRDERVTMTALIRVNGFQLYERFQLFILMNNSYSFKASALYLIFFILNLPIVSYSC